MRPAFRRGWEGEGKPNRRPGAGQRARSDRHTGAAILLWEREGKALGVPTQSGKRSRQAPPRTNNGTVRFLKPQRGTTTAPLHGATPTVGLRRQASPCRSLRESAAPAKGRSADRSRASGKERGKSASGSAQRLGALKERSGKECDFRKSRSFSHAPDRHPKGQDYRLGAHSA